MNLDTTFYISPPELFAPLAIDMQILEKEAFSASKPKFSIMTYCNGTFIVAYIQRLFIGHLHVNTILRLAKMLMFNLMLFMKFYSDK